MSAHRTVVGVAQRAWPRVAGVLVGVALVVTGDGLLLVLGVAVLVLSLATNPVSWWRHVRTGERPPMSVAPEYAEPGTSSVQLREVGDRLVAVVRALRETTGAGLVEAKNLTDSAPTVVAIGLSTASAARVQSRLEQAGATARVLTASDA